MIINRLAVKAQAKEIIRNSKPKVLYVGAVYFVFSLVISLLVSKLYNISASDLYNYMAAVFDGNYNATAAYSERIYDALMSPAANIISIALAIASTLVGAGFIIFLLNSIRGTEPSIGNLLDGFAHFGKIIWLNILMFIFVWLWSILLVIPGIIAAYRYSMAIYILIDNPQMSALDCIRESKRMTSGYKGQLFMLELSFFGWVLLTTLPYVGYIVQLWTLPYMSMTSALYYEHLRGATPQVVFQATETRPPWEG